MLGGTQAVLLAYLALIPLHYAKQHRAAESIHMAGIYLLLEARDQAIGTELSERLQQCGIAVQLAIVNQFPIADPLASRFATVRDSFAVIALLISHQSRQTVWVLREALTQQAMIDAGGGRSRFVTLFTTPNAVPPWLADQRAAYTIAATADGMLPYLRDQLTLAQP